MNEQVFILGGKLCTWTFEGPAWQHPLRALIVLPGMLALGVASIFTR